jgi:hypothetical protein
MDLKFHEQSKTLCQLGTDSNKKCISPFTTKTWMSMEVGIEQASIERRKY